MAVPYRRHTLYRRQTGIMKRSTWLTALSTIVLFTSASVTIFAQKMDVKVVDRQEHETEYNYVVPSYSSSQTTGDEDCSISPSGMATNANCSQRSTTTGYTTPAREGSFSVSGATFILLLPDGRAAVVNCMSKFAEHFAGAAGNHRSCRMPLVDDIQAEFKGKSAKLYWVVSLDGKKVESETYTILAVLDKSPAPTETKAQGQPQERK